MSVDTAEGWPARNGGPGCPPSGSDEGSAHIVRRGDNTGGDRARGDLLSDDHQLSSARGGDRSPVADDRERGARAGSWAGWERRDRSRPGMTVDVGPGEARDVAVNAYIYIYPLVTMRLYSRRLPCSTAPGHHRQCAAHYGDKTATRRGPNPPNAPQQPSERTSPPSNHVRGHPDPINEWSGSRLPRHSSVQVANTASMANAAHCYELPRWDMSTDPFTVAWQPTSARRVRLCS
jgi:hypothetical protein